MTQDLFGHAPRRSPGERALDKFSQGFQPGEPPPLGAGPYDGDSKASACRTLWREVIWQTILDLQEGWGCSPAEHADACAWFRGSTPQHVRNRGAVCALADIEESALLAKYRAHALTKLARDAIGRQRWETRRDNLAMKETATPGTQQTLWDRAMEREILRERCGLAL